MAWAGCFPGQGSQSVGMLHALSDQCPEIIETFAEVSEVLGYDLWPIVAEGPETRLNETDVTQPAMLASGVGVWRAWLGRGGRKPDMLAGHSLGEYSALVASDALNFADAVRLVQQRARAMQAAVAGMDVGMAAVLGADVDQVSALCAAVGDVECANFNAPDQTVIAGIGSGIAEAVERAAEFGARRVVPLAVSVPSHCALMRPAADTLREVLAGVEVRVPKIPVLHNVDCQPRSDGEAIKAALCEQLYLPVRWFQTVQAMQSNGLNRYLEFGPGKVLAGLFRRIDRSLEAAPVFDPDSLQRALAA